MTVGRGSSAMVSRDCCSRHLLNDSRPLACVVNSTAAFPVRSPVEPLRRFFRTPKGLLIAVLALLAGIAAYGSGLVLVVPGLAGAVAVAMAIDAPILRYRDGKWSFPSGALLTGMIVAMVLSPHEPWHVAAITAAVGVLSKYVVRTR